VIWREGGGDPGAAAIFRSKVTFTVAAAINGARFRGCGSRGKRLWQVGPNHEKELRCRRPWVQAFLDEGPTVSLLFLTLTVSLLRLYSTARTQEHGLSGP
jgi:hypothetical protein